MNNIKIVPPNIIDESSSSDTLATEGMRVTLSCQAEGNPIPIIKWRREDHNEIKICKDQDAFGYDVKYLIAMFIYQYIIISIITANA